MRNAVAVTLSPSATTASQAKLPDYDIANDAPKIRALEEWFSKFEILRRKRHRPKAQPRLDPGPDVPSSTTTAPPRRHADVVRVPQARHTADPPQRSSHDAQAPNIERQSGERNLGPETRVVRRLNGPPSPSDLQVERRASVGSGKDFEDAHRVSGTDAHDSGVSTGENAKAPRQSTETRLASTPVDIAEQLRQVASSADKSASVLEITDRPPVSLKAKGKAVDCGGGFSMVGQGDISVRIPATKLERLAKLNFVSHRTTHARPLAMNPAELAKLRALWTFLTPVQVQVNMFGKALPRCRFHMVTLDDNASSPELAKYICVEGLRTASEITLFHKVMSTKRYLYLSEPYKLCYEALEISRPAMDLDSQYRLQRMADEGTLCGSLLETRIGSEVWLSTIGGLIEIGDQDRVYAMTTSHRPGAGRQSFQASSSTTVASPVDTLREDDFPDDVESALVFIWDEPPPSQSTTVKDSLMDLSRLTEDLMSDFDQIFIESSKVHDWTLVPVSRVRQSLPNFIMDDRGRHYIFDVCQSPSGCQVVINAGVSGNCFGTMSLSPSFLIGGQESAMETWAVHLDGDASVQLGDSGSWVVDITDEANFTAVGHVVACSRGRAHVYLMTSTIESISTVISQQCQAILASPLVGLIAHANRCWALGDMAKVTMLMDDALSLEFLTRIPDNTFATALKELVIAKKRRDDGLENLIHLLAKEGSGIIDILNDCVGRQGPPPGAEDVLEELSFIYFTLARHRVRVDQSMVLPERLAGSAQHPHKVPSSMSQVLSPSMESSGIQGRNTIMSHRRLSSEREREILETTSAPNEPSRSLRQEKPVAVSLSPEPEWRHMEAKSLLWAPYIMVSTVFGGLAASAVWERFYAGNNSRIGLSEGALGGLISGALMAVQVPVLWLASRWELDIKLRIAVVRSTWLKLVTITLVLNLLVANGRALLLVLYISAEAGIDNRIPLYSSAAVASILLFVSSMSPSLFFLLRRQLQWRLLTPRKTRTYAVAVFAFIVFELLATVVYIAMCKILGQELLQYGPAVVMSVVYISVSLLWPVPLLLLASPWIVRHLLRFREITLEPTRHDLTPDMTVAFPPLAYPPNVPRAYDSFPPSGPEVTHSPGRAWGSSPTPDFGLQSRYESPPVVNTNPYDKVSLPHDFGIEQPQALPLWNQRRGERGQPYSLPAYFPPGDPMATSAPIAELSSRGYLHELE